METLNVIVSEMWLCLVVAWVLGFLVAWILFRKVQNEYEREIADFEESLSYVTASNKIQEKELIAQSLKLQEFEKSIGDDEISSKKVEIKDELYQRSEDKDLLKRIEDNLYTPKKNF